jgi:hypothetical protein
MLNLRSEAATILVQDDKQIRDIAASAKTDQLRPER